MSSGPETSATRRKGLGRGLDALLGAGPEGDGAEPAIIDVDPSTVAPNPEQPRRHFEDEALAALSESMRLHGLLQPIVVERLTGGRYRLVAGERRLRAALLGGITSIPALVRPTAESARHSLELALTENLLRANLSPLEEAAAFGRLSDAFGLSHEAIALRVGRSRPVITNAIRLLALPAPVQAALAEGRISAGHARTLLGLPDAAAQEDLAIRIERDGLSVRDTERAVQAGGRTRVVADGRARPRPQPPRPDDDALRRGFESLLGLPARLEPTGRGFRLVVEIPSDEDLHTLYTRLGGPQL